MLLEEPAALLGELLLGVELELEPLEDDLSLEEELGGVDELEELELGLLGVLDIEPEPDEDDEPDGDDGEESEPLEDLEPEAPEVELGPRSQP